MRRWHHTLGLLVVTSTLTVGFATETLAQGTPALALSSPGSIRAAHPRAGTLPAALARIAAGRLGWYGLGGHTPPRGPVTIPSTALPGHTAALRAAGRAAATLNTATACTTGFTVVPSPTVSGASTELRAVSSLSPSNVWAVGDYQVDTIAGPLPVPLAEHYNGTSWTAAPTPAIPTQVPSGELLSVSGTSGSDVWAVGDYIDNTGLGQALIEHFDGTRWSLAGSPALPFGQLGNYLTSVKAISPTNVWAVGYYEASSTAYQTLIEHYNGVSWTVVASPNVGTSYNFLLGVTAISPTNVLAVGGYYTGYSTVPVTARTLSERFNGVSWSVVPSPNLDTQLGADNNFLFGVTAVPGTGTAWAVGAAVLDVQPGDQSTQALVERWTGSGWSLVPSPSFLPDQGSLFAVAPVSATDVYAVGAYLPGSGFDQTLIEQWNGGSWNRVSSPNAVTLFNDLLGVSASAVTRQVIAVGTYLTGTYYAPGTEQTLVEMACGI